VAPGKKKPSGRKKSILACDRRYPKPVKGEKKEKGEGRNKSARGCNCKFSLICIKNEARTGWEIRYREP
jgi:hypothetical protein